MNSQESRKRNVERRRAERSIYDLRSGGRVGQQRGRSCFLRAGEKRWLHTQDGVTAYLPRILRVSITHIRFDIIGSNNLYSHLNSKSRPIGAMSDHYRFIVLTLSRTLSLYCSVDRSATTILIFNRCISSTTEKFTDMYKRFLYVICVFEK